MFNLYLASHYERREEVCAYRKLLQNRGFVVTSRWLDGEQDQEKWAAGVYGQWDLEDIDNSHFLIAFTDNEPHIRGGLQTEIGYALALDARRVMIVGPRTSVFLQNLPIGRAFDDYKECFRYLEGLSIFWKKQKRMFPVLRPSKPISMYSMYLNDQNENEDEALSDNSNRPRWNDRYSNTVAIRRYTDNLG